jgi:anti-sigma B factor antagonist
VSVPEYEPFSCQVHAEDHAMRVVPSGELDLLTTPEVQRRLSELHAAGHRQLVLDLSDVSFMDSTALHMVMQWTDASNADGFAFRVAPGPARNRRLFELVGIAGRLQPAE